MTPKKKPVTFPAAPDTPPAPAFGWVCNPSRLTGNEAEAIKTVCGVSPYAAAAQQDPETLTLVAPYVAVAYARRADPDLPWETAGRIPTLDLVYRFPDEDEREAEMAQAVEHAISEGQEAPDPS